jgi:5-methylcytosine-specific restriction endonuclease McrA
MKIQSKPLSKYKKELDKVFSIYIRYRDNGKCFTCPLQRHPKQMQNGHFVPRQYLATRWDERNCNCQCYADNMLYNGQPSKYATELKKKYGEGIIEELESRRKEITKLTPQWYEEKIKYYKEINKQNEN